MASRTHARTIVSASVLAFMLLMTGCAADEAAAPTPTDAASPSTSGPTAPSTPSESVAPYAVPTPLEGERARAVYDKNGPDGIPTTTITAVAPASAGETLTVRGACEGDSVDVLLATATPSPKTIIEGTIDCGADAHPFHYTTEYDGVVQLSFVNTNDVTGAWAVLIAE